MGWSQFHAGFRHVMELSKAYDTVNRGPGSITESIWQTKAEQLEKEVEHLRGLKSSRSKSRSPSTSPIPEG